MGDRKGLQRGQILNHLPPLHLPAALGEFLFSTYRLHFHLISREQEHQRHQENKRQPKSQSTYPPTSRSYPDPWGTPDIFSGGYGTQVQQPGFWTPQYLPRQAAPSSWAAPMRSLPLNSTNSSSHHVSFDPTVTIYPTHDRTRSPGWRSTTSSRPSSGPAHYYDSLPPPTPFAGKTHSSALHRNRSPSARTSGVYAVPPIPSPYFTPAPSHPHDASLKPILKRPLGRPTSGSASEPYDFAIHKWAKGDDCRYKPA